MAVVVRGCSNFLLVSVWLSGNTSLLTNNGTTAYKTRWELKIAVNSLEGRTHQKRTHQQVKPQYNKKEHTHTEERASLEHLDKKIKESHRIPTTEVHPIKTAGKVKHWESQKRTKRVTQNGETKKEPTIKRNGRFPSKRAK